jgi:L-lactate dehydrogenase complex protein LldG
VNARDTILKNVRKSQPQQIPRPALRKSQGGEVDLQQTFKVSLELAAGKLFLVKDKGNVNSSILEVYPDATVIASGMPHVVPGTVDLAAVDDPHLLQDVDLMVCRAEIGVAENGALWIQESEMVHRAAPFISANLAVVLEKDAIVADMHEAYDEIKVDSEGFGVFVAGPSKTADIEQALVIGAHGPRSLTVFLVE